MEAVAAAASIAGIITLAAQAIDGLQTLHTFFAEISTASKTINRLLSDINSLITVLHNIDDVLHQVERQRKNQNFAQLDIKVEDCSKDVKVWLETAKALRPGSERGGRSWVRRARLAAKGEVVGRIKEEIGRHRQALCLSLAVFGRRIDLHTSEQIHQMRGRFDDALTTSLSNHGAHEEALRRIEQYSITSMRSSAHSIRSMDSIRTELSRLEAMITISRTASTSNIEQVEEDPIVGSSRSEVRPTTTEHYLREEGESSRHFVNPRSPRDSRNGSSSASNYSSKASSRLPPRDIDVRTHPADLRNLVKEQESISKRFSEISNGNGSALLYAQFSRDTSPAVNARNRNLASSRELEPDTEARRLLDNQSHLATLGLPPIHMGPSGTDPRFASAYSSSHERAPRSERTSVSNRTNDRSSDTSNQHQGSKDASETIDHGSEYSLLKQSLAAVTSPVVSEYVSLQTLISLCEGHLKILEEGPVNILSSETSSGNNHISNVKPHISQLRGRIESLQEAVDSCSRKCLSAGHSLSDLDEMVFLIRGRRPEQQEHFPRFSVAQDNSQDNGMETQNEQTEDRLSDDSDAYFSTAE